MPTREKMDSVPRRARLELNTPAELAIRAAVDAVEVAGAHPLLTEAVILLGRARERVADFVDGYEPPAGESMATELRITVGRELFRFVSFTQWANKASSWFSASGYATYNTVCVDANGRVLTCGADFRQAQADGAYPVTVYAARESA